MIDAGVRGSLILLAAFAALRFLRHRSAAERELVLRCAILAMLVLPAIAATANASLLWLAGVAVMTVRLALSVRRGSRHRVPGTRWRSSTTRRTTPSSPPRSRGGSAS